MIINNEGYVSAASSCSILGDERILGAPIESGQNIKFVAQILLGFFIRVESANSVSNRSVWVAATVDLCSKSAKA